MAMFLYLFYFINLLAFVRLHEEDNYTVQYTTDTFAENVPKKNHFIMFYAPWCGHCKRLAPTWEQLAEMLNEDNSNVLIAKVDCTVDSSICSDQDVTGYPTLKFFRKGEREGHKFPGTRDLPSLTAFINEQLRMSEERDFVPAVAETTHNLIELDDHTFDKHIATGKHFIKFYAPWCGHCQKLAPTWERLAQSFDSERALSISKLDCTLFRSICNQFDIKGYPTLLWIENGKKVDKYKEDRTLEDLKAYVNKMLGSRDSSPEVKRDDVANSLVKTLNEDDFRSSIEQGVIFVKFFAPWCGHCKRLAPTWEELAKKFSDKSDVTVAKVDCTVEQNKELCNKEEVDGFPTMFMYRKGRKLAEYSGDRSLEDLEDFVLQYSEVHDEL